MGEDSQPDALANKSVLKALTILSALGGFPEGATATDLARVTGSSRPTVFRMLLSLEASGYVERTEGTYRLGWELIRLSRLPHLDRGLAARIKPILDHYAAIINETVNFALGAANATFDIVAESSAGRILSTEEQFIGRRFPPHASSSGKIMLSEMSDEQVRDLLPARLEKFTERTIVRRAQLLEHLHVVREQGYAVLDGELEIGLLSISVPVRSAAGQLVGVMAVYGSSERMKLQGVEHIVAHLREASARVCEAVAGPSRR